MKKLFLAFVLVVSLTMVYALVPKTRVMHLWGENAPYTLTYTGLGIQGSGFLGFEPRRLEASTVTGFDGKAATVTITPASSGWTYLAQGERGQVQIYGFATSSVPAERGILVPDLFRHLDASYFYSPDGSATGSLRQGTGAYDAVTSKCIYHVRVDAGRPTISKTPQA